MNDEYKIEPLRIEELVMETGLKPRTIRYCVHKGLIQPPAGRGRRAFYRRSDLQRLIEIRNYRGQGLSFTKIREILKSRTPQTWTRYELKPGLEVHIESGLEKQSKINIPNLIDLISAFFLDE